VYQILSFDHISKGAKVFFLQSHFFNPSLMTLTFNSTFKRADCKSMMFFYDLSKSSKRLCQSLKKRRVCEKLQLPYLQPSGEFLSKKTCRGFGFCDVALRKKAIYSLFLFGYIRKGIQDEAFLLAKGTPLNKKFFQREKFNSTKIKFRHANSLADKINITI